MERFGRFHASDVVRVDASLYDRNLVAIDPTPSEENRAALQRTEQICKLTGATIYVLQVARGHVVAEDISAGSGGISGGILCAT
jgi:hypothetical protein